MHLNFNLPKKILGWYDNNKRNLPWRVGKNSPKKLYYRLLSEFMLQQTQVKTVIPYFKKFIKKHKTLKSFSKLSETKTLKLWEGLGYYRRARNLLATSKILVLHHNSKLPRTFKKIKTLPGVGDYTANALLGLVYDQPVIAVDGNVKRMFSRILNIDSEKINFDDFLKIDIRAGTVLHAEINKKTSSDSVFLVIDFGSEIGLKKSSAHLCANYKATDLIGIQIIAVINFKPKQIGKMISEVLVLGFPDKNKDPILVSPLKKVLNGSRLF